MNWSTDTILNKLHDIDDFMIYNGFELTIYVN